MRTLLLPSVFLAGSKIKPIIFCRGCTKKPKKEFSDVEGAPRREKNPIIHWVLLKKHKSNRNKSPFRVEVVDKVGEALSQILSCAFLFRRKNCRENPEFGSNTSDNFTDTEETRGESWSFY
jgi:hypothetical protein